MTARRIALSLLALCACRGDPSSTVAPPSSPPREVSAPTAASPATAPPGSAAGATTPSSSAAASPSAAAKTISFDADKVDAPPSGFSFGRTGEGAEGKWLVRSEPGAPSGGNVLAQLDADKTDFRFPVAYANEPDLKDVDLSVRCKTVSGGVDQACGLVFRLKDAKNYYITRANALEGNVRLYHVKDGRRSQIASFSVTIAKGKWHELRAVARGDLLEVYWNGAKAIEQHDTTFKDAGKVGLWTKADSVTYFDDLRITPL